jgi:hypothetical protein
MASLLESLTQTLTPDLTGTIAKTAGLDANLASKGLEIVGPLVTGALANTASTPQGAGGLMNMLPQATASSGLGNIVNMITGGGAPSTMLSGIFGAGLGAISATLDKALGFKASPLIALAAPIVLNLVKQRATESKLDGGGVAKMLQDEQAAFQSKGGASAQIVRQALDAGKEAAAVKGRYAADKWTTIRLGPLAAAGRVIGASPSGMVGAVKELAASADAVTAAQKDAAPTSLLGVAFESALTDDERKTLVNQNKGLMAVITEAVEAVSTRSPSDASAYGRMLVDVATRVAEASKEGGFLGIGGTRVSAEEQAAIDEIKAAVNQRVRAAGSTGV